MTLAEIREWLRTQVECPNWYIGQMNANKEESISLYNIPSGAPYIAIGGLSETSYSTKSISVLVRWGKNANLAEQKAQEVYGVMFGQSASIAGKRVIMFQMRATEPVSVRVDELGIYEHVIEVNIIYER